LSDLESRFLFFNSLKFLGHIIFVDLFFRIWPGGLSGIYVRTGVVVFNAVIGAVLSAGPINKVKFFRCFAENLVESLLVFSIKRPFLALI